jgi:hypothetical protein
MVGKDTIEHTFVDEMPSIVEVSVVARIGTTTLGPGAVTLIPDPSV